MSSDGDRDELAASSSGSVDAALGVKRKRSSEGKYGDREAQMEYWRKKKAEKKERDKQRRAAEKEKQTKEWEALPDEEKERRRQQAVIVHEKRREEEARAEALRVARMTGTEKVPMLLFDVCFENIMSETDTRSTIQQLKLSYAILKKHNFCLRPAFIGYEAKDECAPASAAVASGPTMEPAPSGMIANALTTYGGFKAHPPTLVGPHWSTWAAEFKERLVYLTADSDVVLDKLDANDIYIVGSFVDHNKLKGHTMGIATKYGVRTARLPLKETLVKLGNLCKVLTVNHVTEMMATFQDTQSWTEACQCLPTRRQ